MSHHPTKAFLNLCMMQTFCLILTPQKTLYNHDDIKMAHLITFEWALSLFILSHLKIPDTQYIWRVHLQKQITPFIKIVKLFFSICQRCYQWNPTWVVVTNQDHKNGSEPWKQRLSKNKLQASVRWFSKWHLCFVQMNSSFVNYIQL